MDDRKRHEAGTKIRREVLGNAHVDRAKAQETEFNADFQDLITRYAWGEIWTRPGLNKKTRSMLNLAMLTALGKSAEIKLHVRGAINNGLTVDDIKEVLLHATVYCGIPAGLDAFKSANEVLKDMGKVK